VKLRFQADADLNRAIVRGALRRVAEMDFQPAAVSLEGLDDLSVLGLAAQQGRVLVSHDVTTMEAHFREFIQTRTSPGLVLIPQRQVTIGQAVESLVLLWELADPADMENRVCLIPSLVIY